MLERFQLSLNYKPIILGALIANALFVPFLLYWLIDYNFIVLRVSFILIIWTYWLFYPRRYFSLNISAVFLMLLLLLNAIFNGIRGSFLTVSYLFIFISSTFYVPSLGEYLRQRSQIFSNVFLFFFWFIIFLLFFQLFLYPVPRFTGFTSSATTFSTYLLLLFIYFLRVECRSTLRILASILILILIVASQTRTSIGLFVLILIFYRFSKFIDKHKFLSFLFVLVLALSYYPIISFFETTISILFKFRTNEAGLDYSVISRLAYFSNQVEAVRFMNVFEFFFGKGVNTSQSIGSTILVDEIDQHNDFFLILYELGFLYSLIFFKFLSKLVNSFSTLSLLTIYLFSFYHNMAFDAIVFQLLFIGFSFFKDSDV